MKIDGKAIASDIFQNLQKQVHHLKEKNLPAGRQGVTPHLAIVLVGDNPASVSYVNRKKLKAEELGCKATIINYELSITNETLLGKIKELNEDPNIHGIIIQRPLPQHIDVHAINQAVIPAKDVDAFHADTPFDMPLAKAALLLLKYVYQNRHPGLDPGSKKIDSGSEAGMTFKQWLQSKHITVIGKGETGGGPIITLLTKYGVTPNIIDSKTKNPTEITKSSDVIFSAVGKEKVLTADMLKKGVILISVGQHKQADHKFHGDYEEKDIEHVASWYSPTPGGVGPVNVASLLQNLLEAVEKQTV